MNGFDMTAAVDAAHPRPSERVIKMSDRSATDIERIIDNAHALRSAYTAQLVGHFARCAARQARSADRRLRGPVADRSPDRPQVDAGKA